MKLQDLITELIKNHSYDENVSLNAIQALYVEKEANTNSKEYQQGYSAYYLNYTNPYFIGTQKYLDFCKGHDDFMNKNEELQDSSWR